MCKALSIVLAGLLVILPVEQVVAQTVRQEALDVQQAVPTDGAARLFRVPPLTENTARLLRTTSDRALLDTDLADVLLVQEDTDGGLAWGWYVLFVAAGVAFIAVVAAYTIAIRASGDPDCCG